MARKLIGTVVSDVQDKTIVVKTQRRVTHSVYKKQYTVSKKYQAHDEKNEAQLGDKVSIVETRPISKHKSFKLESVIERKEGAAEEVVA
jgi:small subunit ribosomal protein S17